MLLFKYSLNNKVSLCALKNQQTPVKSIPTSILILKNNQMARIESAVYKSTNDDFVEFIVRKDKTMAININSVDYQFELSPADTMELFGYMKDKLINSK